MQQSNLRQDAVAEASETSTRLGNDHKIIHSRMPFISATGGAYGYGRASTLVKPVYAQWATKVAGTSFEEAVGVARDSQGNVYITGYINGTVTIGNFNSQPVGGGDVGLSTYGTMAATFNGSAFLAKYNSSGICQWATKIDSASDFAAATSVTVDPSDNVIITGAYGTTITLYSFASAPVGGGSVGLSAFGTLTNAGALDILVAKYDSNGTVLWATRCGGTLADIGRGISCYSDGNIYVAGLYRGTTTFNSFASAPGGGGPIVVSAYGTMTASGLNPDIFLVKYNSSGIIQWATRIGGTGFDEVFNSLAVDPSGNVCLQGVFTGTITLASFSSAPSPPSTAINLVSYGTLSSSGANDICIVKYTPNGSVIWGTRIGSAAGDNSYGITTDSQGNIYVTGFIGANATVFNFSANPPTSVSPVVLTTYGIIPIISPTDAILVKYNSSGTAQWATRISGTGSDRGSAVACDQNNNVYVVGFFVGTSTISNFSTPPVGGGNIGLTSYGTLTNSGGTDGFIVKYNPNGSALFGTSINGTGNDEIQSVTVGQDGFLYISGYFLSSSLTIRNFLSAPSTAGDAINLSIYGTLPQTLDRDMFLIKYGPV
jgi:hypothetical protein